MAQSSDVQYVAYLKAKFHLADADLLQVISLSQRGGYTPSPVVASSSSEEKYDIPGAANNGIYEEEVVEEEVEEEIEEEEVDDDEFMDESFEEQVFDSPNASPAPVPAPLPLSNNDQIVEQSNALVVVDDDVDEDIRGSTLKMPEDERASTLKMPEDIEPEDQVDAPDDEKNTSAIVPAKSQALVPVDDDAEKGIAAVAPPIQDSDSSSEDKRDENPALYVAACILLFLLIAAAVILILLFVTETIPKWWEDDDDNPTMADYEPGNCDFSGQAQPNFISQCECFGTISVVNEEVRSQYDTFVAELIPNIYPNWSFQVSSCDPANQALLWLSTGNVPDSFRDQIQRYTMAYLYISTEGQQWTQDSLWLSDQNVCMWLGLSCTNNELERVHLMNNALRGEVSLKSSVTGFRLIQWSLRNETTWMLPTVAFSHKFLCNAF